LRKLTINTLLERGNELQESRWQPAQFGNGKHLPFRFMELPHNARARAWVYGALWPLGENYFPSTEITVRSTMITISPAEETAAAVRSPEIAEAILSPARTIRMIKSTTIPRGVLIMLMMEPEFLGIGNDTSPKDRWRAGSSRKTIGV